MNRTTGESRRTPGAGDAGVPARALALCSLCSLGVAYPLFQVLAASPEFFVARNTTLPLLIGAVVMICVALPLAIVALEALAGAVDPHAADGLHAATLFILAALTLMPWMKRIDSLGAYSSIFVACLAAGAFVGVHRRSAAVRMFVIALAPAVFVVPAFFIGNRDVYEAVIAAPATFESPDIESAPPIVFIVFDEFPLNSLLDDKYEIDVDRYPNFSALAAGSYWFRNASTVSQRTVWAVPAMLSGLYPSRIPAVPTARYYPNNLFTLLGNGYEMTSFGTFARLCPAGACTHDIYAPKESLSRLLSDLAIVYLHVVAPTAIGQRNLPPIVGDFQGFVSGRGWAEWRRLQQEARGTDVQLASARRVAVFDRFLAAIGPEKESRLYFLHSMLPHAPFRYIPSGHLYDGPAIQGRRFFHEQSQAFADVVHQRHLLQVGFVDSLIGRLLGRLRELGIYDESMIIITSDHGASFRAGADFRNIGDDNYSDILLVPLFVKLPGQTEGIVSDRNVETIDIVPAIADVLSIEMPYEVDGRSLIDFEASDNSNEKTTVLRDRDRTRGRRNTGPMVLRKLTFDDAIEDSYVAWEHKLEVFGSGDPFGLYSIGSDHGLIGAGIEA